MTLAGVCERSPREEGPAPWAPGSWSSPLWAQRGSPATAWTAAFCNMRGPCERAPAAHGRQRWSCAPRDGHSLVSNRGRVCATRREEGDMVLLRAHRLRRLAHGTRQVGAHRGERRRRAQLFSLVFKMEASYSMNIHCRETRVQTTKQKWSPQPPRAPLTLTRGCLPGPESAPHPLPRPGHGARGPLSRDALRCWVDGRAPLPTRCGAAGRACLPSLQVLHLLRYPEKSAEGLLQV